MSLSTNRLYSNISVAEYLRRLREERVEGLREAERDGVVAGRCGP